MKSRHFGTKLRRMLVTLLTVALLASDNTILYAAETGVFQGMVEPDSEEIFGTVSGGDAVVGRLPESFYEEEKPETYGTLVSYNEYSRTYHVDGNQYMTVIGNDGTTYIDEEGNLQPVDNTLTENAVFAFSLFGDGQTSYVNTANDYMVLLPESLDAE